MLEKPKGLKVIVNFQGVPLTLVSDGERQRVTRVYERWQAVEEWWGKEILRNYFRVKTNKGLVYDIYRNAPNGSWFLSRIYD